MSPLLRVLDATRTGTKTAVPGRCDVLPEQPLLLSTPVDVSGDLQLVHPDGSAVEIPRAGLALRPLLDRLDGVHRITEILAGLSPSSQVAASRLMAVLQRAGHLVDASSPGPCRLALIGGGRLGRRLSTELLRLDLSHLTLVGGMTGPIPEVPPHPGSTAAVTHLDHWLELNAPQQLVVVAMGTVEPDRALTDALRDRGQPFLIVRAHRDHAEIGPLVDPDGGGCLRCDDLSRAALDSTWPRVLAGLITAPAEPGEVAMSWAVAQTLTHVDWFCRRSVNPLRSASISVDGNKPGHHFRRWEAVRECGCTGLRVSVQVA